MSDEAVETGRLRLRRPSRADLEPLFTIASDPRVWTHYPSLRHAESARTQAMIDRWVQGWATWGLDTWTARLRSSDAVIGYGGCSTRDGTFWNLGYRLAAEAHGHGYATELAAEAVRRAYAAAPERPVIAYMVEHNVASTRVAVKLGLELVHRAPDAGNPNPDVIRLIYADRRLSADQRAAALG